MTDTPPGDWYCPRCDTYLHASRVTYDETCDTCRASVEWRTADGGDSEVAAEVSSCLHLEYAERVGCLTPRDGRPDRSDDPDGPPEPEPCGTCPLCLTIAKVAELDKRDSAWKQLAKHLYQSGGEAPDYRARGLWVTLFDEANGGGSS